ncbi:MAG: MFS transporter [Dehalococcoidales bacterium]|jgi:FSR family fosmidomycin resistance protein-like MFS transporter|nr:MFS transporter [Dehalococcoidales bacterium]
MQDLSPTGSKPKSGLFHQWGGVPAALFAYTHGSHDQCAGLLTALLPFIRANLGLNYLQSGLLLSAYSITSGASQLLGGWLGDRTKRYLMIGVGLLGVGSATLAIGLTSSFYPMLAVLVIMGVFSGAYHPSAASLISSHFEDARRGKAIAVHMLGGSIGFAMGPILGGLIANAFGWRYAYILLCIPAFFAIGVVWKKFRQWESMRAGEQIVETGAEVNGEGSALGGRLSLAQALGPVAVITVLAIVLQLVAGSAMAFISLYMVDKHSVAPAYAAMLMAVIRAGGIAGSLFGGWLSDKWGRRNAIALAFVATGPLLFLLTILPVSLSLIVVFSLFGFFIQMRQSTIQPYLMDNTPHYLRATVFGIYFGLGIEGQSLLQPVVGYLIDGFGIIDIFQIIALTSTGLSLAALVLIKRPRFR